MSSASQDIETTLRLVPWLQPLPAAEISHLAASARMLHLQDKEQVAWRGRLLSHIVIVSAGRLVMTITSRSGKRHVFGQMRRGQVFGLIPVIEQSTAIHDAQSDGPGAVITLSGDELYGAIHRHHSLAIHLLREFSRRSRQLQDLLAQRNLQSLRQQLVQALLTLVGGNLKGLAAEHPIDLGISQTDLADMLGVSRQTINAEVKKLQQEGLVEVAYANLRIHNLDRLVQAL